MEPWCGELRFGKLTSRNNSATLRVEHHQLVLDAPMESHFVVLKEKVTEIRPARARFWRWSWVLKRSIVLIHTAPNVPSTLVFHAKTLNTNQMLNLLKGSGYCVAFEN